MSAVSLVLNRNFQAINVESWRDSITKLFQGEAVAVDSDLNTYDFEDWCELSKLMKDHPNGFVHSESLKIAIPEAIRLNDFSKVPRVNVVFTRRNCLEHYNYTCCYCGKRFKTTELNFDHVQPKSRGGLSGWSNVVPSCFKCNTLKANRTPEEAGMKMHYRISRPKHHSIQRHILLSLPAQTRVTWQKMIDRAYWDSEIEE